MNYPAMIPGNDIILPQVVFHSRCERCGLCYYDGSGVLCGECSSNPLFDPEESTIMARQAQTFSFAGWTFSVRTVHNPNEVVPKTYLFCYKRLFNPETPSEVYSQVNFSDDGFSRLLYGEAMPPRLKLEKQKRCAAWLIAHWWEHYLEICPCLGGKRDDGEDSNFRRSVIESLLWYDARLGGR